MGSERVVNFVHSLAILIIPLVIGSVGAGLWIYYEKLSTSFTKTKIKPNCIYELAIRDFFVFTIFYLLTILVNNNEFLCPRVQKILTVLEKRH